MKPGRTPDRAMRYLSAREARETGLLLEVNRRLLHPRGLALELTWGGDGSETAVLTVQDHRDDPEGVYFADLDADDVARADLFDEMVGEKGLRRFDLLGSIVQELPTVIGP